jgi:predicted nucleotidyltransferase
MLGSLGLSSSQLELLSALAIQLSEIPGITAAVLGGSYARGTARADSDLDVGVYYSEQALPDLDAVRRCAELLSEPGRPSIVTGFYAWGP